MTHHAPSVSVTDNIWGECPIYFASVRNKIRKPVVQVAQGAEKAWLRRLAQRLHFLSSKEVVEATRAKKTNQNQAVRESLGLPLTGFVIVRKRL